MVSLPTEMNVPSDNFQDYVFLIGGEKKVGKTAFAAQFPKSIILEGEPGNANHLKCRFIDIHTWTDFTDCITLLEKDLNYCKTLVVDDLNNIYMKLVRHIKYNILKLNEMDALKINQWDAPREMLAKAFARLRALHSTGIGLIITNHIEIRTVDDIYGKQYSQLLPNLNKQPKELIDEIGHFVGIMMKDTTGRRHLYIHGTSFIKCGHGFDTHFLNPNTGKPLAYIDLGESAQEGFQNFIAAWYNSYIPPTIEGAIEKNIEGENVPKPAPVTRPVPIVKGK